MLEVRIEQRLGAFSLDASFNAGDGDVTALFGASGAGKTSILNAIAGLSRPVAGRIVAAGDVLYDSTLGVDVKPERRGIGYVFQEPRLFPHMSVRDNLRFGRRRARRRDAEPAPFDDVVDMLGIAGLLGRHPVRLSGGEKQRVSIGRALLAAPRALLLDEPLAALDAPRRGEILPYLERLRDELRIPVLLVSHAFDEVMRLAANVIMIDGGRVRGSGAPGVVAADLGLAGFFEQPVSIFDGRVVDHVDAHLSRIDCGGFELIVPRAVESGGVRVMLNALDVTLATSEPVGLSANNVLAGTVAELRPTDAGIVDVRLTITGPGIEDHTLVARVTAHSRARLGLAPGQRVYAIIKTVKVAC